MEGSSRGGRGVAGKAGGCTPPLYWWGTHNLLLEEVQQAQCHAHHAADLWGAERVQAGLRNRSRSLSTDRAAAVAVAAAGGSERRRLAGRAGAAAAGPRASMLCMAAAHGHSIR